MGLRLVSGHHADAYGIWLVLIRPAMPFGKGYEFVEVSLWFARPQEPKCSREVQVSYPHLLYGWRHEAGRNEGYPYSSGHESQCPIHLAAGLRHAVAPMPRGSVVDGGASIAARVL